MTTMTGARRLIAVVGATVAVLLGSAFTAHATFSETVAAAPVQVGTATLAPVDGLEVKFVVCDLATVSAQVEWRRSPARGVSGYRVTARMQNGQTEVISQVGPDVLEVTFSRDRAWLQQRPSFTVTLLTSYGWTSQTASSAVLTC
jgi:hypothetical protein